MNNIAFVKKYVAATKAGELTWENVTRSMSNQLERNNLDEKFDQAFFVERSSSYVVINRVTSYDAFGNETGYSYCLIIFDYRYHELFRITEESILDVDDGVIITNPVLNKRLLSRLYRLAERSAKRIDALLEQLTEGLTAENVDEYL